MPLRLRLNPHVSEDEFQAMLAQAGAPAGHGLTLGTVQQRVFRSYWRRARVEGVAGDAAYELMLALPARSLRRLLHPEASRVQGRHWSELD